MGTGYAGAEPTRGAPPSRRDALRADEAAALRACGDRFWLDVPFNRGAVGRTASDDPLAAICNGGRPYVGSWIETTRDGGRTWALGPQFGWCATKADSTALRRSGLPPMPDRLHDAPPRGTPRS